MVDSSTYRKQVVRSSLTRPAAKQEGELGARAEVEFERHVGAAGALRHSDLWLLSRLIGGSHANHGELLSYLFFDRAFTTVAAQLGAKHAQQSIRPVRWQTTL